MAAQGITRLVDELMWHVEDQDRRIFHCVDQRRIGHKVVRQADTRKVLYVLVEVIDEVGELLRRLAKWRFRIIEFRVLWHRHFFLIYPHLHLLFKQVRICLGVLRYDF